MSSWSRYIWRSLKDKRCCKTAGKGAVHSPSAVSYSCDLMDCSPPGSSVHGILQARILEWLPCPPQADLPNPEIEPNLPQCRWILYQLSNLGSPSCSNLACAFMDSGEMSKLLIFWAVVSSFIKSFTVNLPYRIQNVLRQFLVEPVLI